MIYLYDVPEKANPVSSEKYQNNVRRESGVRGDGDGLERCTRDVCE